MAPEVPLRRQREIARARHLPHGLTSLKVARERRQTARDLLTKGIDLGEARKAEKSSRSSQSEGTFEAVARKWHKVIHAARATRRAR